jgi:hypothetical protein
VKVEKVPQLPSKAPFTKRFEQAVGERAKVPRFQKLAMMLLDHLAGILNYCRTKVRVAFSLSVLMRWTMESALMVSSSDSIAFA